MPEIFNDDAVESLRTIQRTVHDAINELNAFVQHASHTSGVDTTTWETEVRTKSLAAGLDLTEWLGNPNP